MSTDNRLTWQLALLSAAQHLLYIGEPGRYSPERVQASAMAADSWMRLADRIGSDGPLTLDGLEGSKGWV